jgi:hypothetical protein
MLIGSFFNLITVVEPSLYNFKHPLFEITLISCNIEGSGAMPTLVGLTALLSLCIPLSIVHLDPIRIGSYGPSPRKAKCIYTCKK